MAGQIPRGSMLPTIKCSICGNEIEISSMGDHVCSAGASERSTDSYSSRTDHDRIEEHPHSPLSVSSRSPSVLSEETSPDYLLPRTSFVRPTKTKPPPIDAIAANGLNTSATAAANSAGSSSASKHTAPRLDSEDFSFRVPLRSATYPEQRYPENSRLEVPSSHKPARSADFDDREDGIDELYGPRSPNALGGSNILERMDTISPGPFNAKPRKSPLKNLGSDGARNIRVIRRDEPTQPSSSLVPPREPSAPPSGSLPYGPPPPRPARPDRPEELLDNSPTTSPSLGREVSGTDEQPFDFGQSASSPGGSMHKSTPSIARSSVYTTYTVAESDTSDYAPYGQSGQDDVPPLPEIPRMPAHSATPARTPTRPVLETATAAKAQAGKPSNANAPHTPSESASSNGSRSLFDDGTGSSRSSPPTSTGSILPPDGRLFDSGEYGKTSERMQPALLEARGDRNVHAAQEQSRPGQRPAPKRQDTWENAQHNRSLGAPPTPPLESPMDPAVRNGLFTNISSRSPSPNPATQVAKPLGNLQHAESPGGPQTRPALPQRTSSKGNCRGCNKEIKGRSIKAADGQLTGRYHRECFVCKTCRKPFETADFYVLNNNPYCAHHYHILNHSLCHACNSGIEGRYLETASKTAFHAECFTCHACRQPLSQDYFEVNNVPYCEADAWRVYSQNNKLQPSGNSRRFPERRTTRLMMM